MDIKNEEEVKFAFYYKAIYELEAHSVKFLQNWIRILSFEN